ncbi:hypothetical protein WT97_15170 [Burkholderia sp. MSMB1459WGS]|nr:hypothetical protein WT97_15170 [Burkholderia sp. MSMB1459WGS]
MGSPRAAAASPAAGRAQPARDDVPASQADHRDLAPGAAAIMHRTLSFENTIDAGSDRIADDQET